MFKGIVGLADMSVGLLPGSDELWTCVGATDLISKNTQHVERCSRIPMRAQIHLASAFNKMRDMSLSVNASNIVNEYVTVCNNECGELSFEAVKQYICRRMKNNKIVQCADTHQAQNGKHCDAVMNKCTTEMKYDMSIYGIPPGNVVNFDETNIDFGCVVTKTLSHKGAKTVSSACAAKSGQLTIMLGVAMDGHKFSPYKIYKAK